MAYEFKTDSKKGGEKKNEKSLFMKNEYVTKVFNDPNNKEYVLRVLRGAFKNDEVFASDELEIFNADNNDVMKNKLDYIAENDKVYVIIAVNFSNRSSTMIENKNASGMRWLIERHFPEKSDKNYDNMKPIYQLNLNLGDRLGKGEFMYESMLMDTKHYIVADDSYKIVDINVAHLKEIDYDEIKKMNRGSLEYSIYFMISNEKEKLSELYENDDTMKKVIEKVNDIEKIYTSYTIYN